MAGDQPVQRDVLPVNGWLMELDPSSGIKMRAPHFTNLSGLNKKTGTMEVVDGGTNVKLFFSDGILEHAPITMTRARDGSPDDAAFEGGVQKVYETGQKVAGTFTQYRFGKAVLEIRFRGLLLNDYNLSDFDTAGSDKSEQSYTAQVDFWEATHKAQ
ncbi:hypothetical protein KW797_01690 [Candidatus Parcubacteria bacterium]|nr:hypothetical protein [Candidatus Parcubacteria bacterium]